jgi:dTMP kinase
MNPRAEFLLFSASRAQLVAEVIRPQLQNGGLVVCDRYYDASLAYQGYGYDLDLEALWRITGFATGGLLPDLVFCLDVPVEVGLRRKGGGCGDAWDRIEQHKLAFHERVRAGYLEMVAAEPGRWVVVDAGREWDAVQKRLRQVILKRL